MTWARWVFTVASLRNRSRAISALDRPRPTCRSTSSSRSVRFRSRCGVSGPGGGRLQKSSTSRRTSPGASRASPALTVRMACTSWSRRTSLTRKPLARLCCWPDRPPRRQRRHPGRGDGFDRLAHLRHGGGPATGLEPSHNRTARRLNETAQGTRASALHDARPAVLMNGWTAGPGEHKVNPLRAVGVGHGADGCL